MQLGQDERSVLSAEEFEKLVDALEIGSPSQIAVAVSGGADSMALALLLHEYCTAANIDLVALTVDHGLRVNSSDEVAQVKKWLGERGIDHQVLNWSGDKPDTNIQDEARKARYRLMGRWCAENGIAHLFLAHHKDDQAETFLIRLFRGSGVDGLSAMEKVADFPVAGGIENYPTLYRPLLEIAKQSLVDYLTTADQNWLEDPSNENEKFTRVKIRELLKNADIEGLDVQRLAATASKMRRVRSLLEQLTASAESEFVSYDGLGFATLKRSFCHTLHEEIALRLLSNILKKVGGNTYPPRHHKLELLFNNLQSDDFPGQTLSGVILFQNAPQEIIFSREINDIAATIKVTETKQMLWDNRFIINIGNETGEIVPLSEVLLNKAAGDIPDIKDRLNSLFDNHQLRDRIVPSLPCIIEGSGKVKLPDLLIHKLALGELDGFSAVFKE